MAATLPANVLDRFERFTLHNSPYPAHARGAAVDLYPGDALRAHSGDALRAHPGGAARSPGPGRGTRSDSPDDATRSPTPGGGTRAPSPVGGEVVDVRTVAAPSREYAADHDHLLLIDVERPTSVAGLVARVMHVDPVVSPGDPVAIGDDLGRLVRSGYFAPWVPDHVHLEFRGTDADPYRARGSEPLALGVDVEPVAWDGTGEVVAAGDTYAVLDSPTHPAPGERWVGVAARGPDGTGVLDGGLPHYDGGGLLGPNGCTESGTDSCTEPGADDGATSGRGPVSLAGQRVGSAEGRFVTWDDVTVLANGRPVAGLSLFCARDAGFGAKLVGETVDLDVGEGVEVAVTTGSDRPAPAGTDG